MPLDERLASRVLAKFRSTAGEGEEACTGLTGYVGRAEPRVASQHAMLFDVAVGSTAVISPGRGTPDIASKRC